MTTAMCGGVRPAKLSAWYKRWEAARVKPYEVTPRKVLGV